MQKMKIEEARQILVKEVLAGLYSSSEVTEAIDTILEDHARLEAFMRSLEKFESPGIEGFEVQDAWCQQKFEICRMNGEILSEGEDALDALRSSNLWEQQPQTVKGK